MDFPELFGAPEEIWGEGAELPIQNIYFQEHLKGRLEQHSEPVFAQVLMFVYGDYFYFCFRPWADTQKGSPRAHLYHRERGIMLRQELGFGIK